MNPRKTRKSLSQGQARHSSEGGKRHVAQSAHFAFSLETKKALGQHFLNDMGVILQIAQAAAELAPLRGNALEIGPGSGALTKALLQDNWRVLAVEKDARAQAGLQAAFSAQFPENFASVCEDILAFEPGNFSNDRHNIAESIDTEQTKEIRESREIKATNAGEYFANFFSAANKPLCIGNLPYYITSDILFWYLKHSSLFCGAIFMVQDEVADRFAAGPGSKSYGRLSARLQLVANVEKILFVPATAFSPPPKVNSAVVRIVPKESPFIDAQEVKAFEGFTALLFSARRKMLRRSLAAEIPNEDFWSTELAAMGAVPDARPDTLTPESLLFLFRKLRQGGLKISIDN